MKFASRLDEIIFYVGVVAVVASLAFTGLLFI
jgi:hypothetical protein